MLFENVGMGENEILGLIIDGYSISCRLKRRMNVMRMMIGNMLKKGLQKLYGKEMRLLSGRKRSEFRRRMQTH